MLSPRERSRPRFVRKLWSATAKLRGTLLRHFTGLLLVALVLAAIIVFLSPYIFKQVPAGYVGVLYRPWAGGTVMTSALREGRSFVLPWNRVINYDARVQTYTETFEAITSDDLHIEMEVTYRFRTLETSIGRLHKVVGPDYRKKLLDPAISSGLREEVSKYQAVDVYGAARTKIQRQVYEDVVSPLNNNMITAVPRDIAAINTKAAAFGRLKLSETSTGNLVELMDVLIKTVTLPATVRAAIERKQEADQLAQEYIYRIAKEKLEAERKEIEGRGIAAFQRQVEPGITPSYLKWRGIEATLSLAQSENSKVVIVGGQNGLPLIFNADDGSNAAPKAKPKPQAKAAPPPKAPQ